MTAKIIRSITDEIVSRFEEEILSGKRIPGEKLDERQLAEAYGASRTPVREALQRLAANGLVVPRGRQGVQVTQLSAVDLLDAFSVVSELEALAASQAARRIRPEQREMLIDAHLACDAARAARDVSAFYDANLIFHDIIAAASQNRVLQDELRRLKMQTSPYRRLITYQAGRMDLSIPEHQVVMNAILENDPLAASQHMRKHVRMLGEGFSDSLHSVLATFG
jgi:DNA-binding GntR family transcriptional regulator